MANIVYLSYFLQGDDHSHAALMPLILAWCAGMWMMSDIGSGMEDSQNSILSTWHRQYLTEFLNLNLHRAIVSKLIKILMFYSLVPLSKNKNKKSSYL